MFICTLIDVIGLILVNFGLLFVLIAGVSRYIEQERCNHEEYHQTMTWHAVCNDCGKDLGFIGNIRDR